MSMDDKWFRYVREKLEQIEEEARSRYAEPVNPRSVHDRTIKALFCHPLIVGSPYWHQSDSRASSMCFDWDQQRFPDEYIKLMKQATPGALHRMAACPYNPHASTMEIAVNNQKILVARLLILGLNHLLVQ